MEALIFWRATRAYSLPASIVPVLLGTVLAAQGFGTDGGGHFALGIFIWTLLGAILIHVGANVLNDYFDYTKGVDTLAEHGSGVLTSGAMSARQALIFALVLIAAAGLCGLALLQTQPAVVLAFGLIGLGCAVLYSALLKRYGLGDFLIILSFGLGLTLGAYAVQVGLFSWRGLLNVALYSLPICLLVDAILHANNLRDAPNDRATGVATLATFLSPAAGQRWQLFLLFGPLAFVLLGVAGRFLPLWSLGTFLAAPILRRAARSGSVEGTAQTHLVFGLLYVGSFLLPPIFLW